MGRPKKISIASIPNQFMQYSQTLAVQLDSLWKRSLPIKLKSQISDDDKVTLVIGNLRTSILSLLKAMPHIIEDLSEPLLSDFKTNGLDALLDGNNRDKFELELNKQVCFKLSPEDAVSSDIAFSNIIAMHTGDEKLKPLHFEIHLKLKPYSLVLACQIAHLYERSIQSDDSPYTLNKMRLYHSIHSLVAMLPELCEHLPSHVLNNFFERGLDCLIDYNDIIEYMGVHKSINKKKLPTKFDDALTNLRSMHSNHNYLPFSHLNLKRQSIDISRVMELSYQDFSDLKIMMEEVGKCYENDGNKNDETIATSLNSSVNHIHKLLKDELSSFPGSLKIQERLSIHSNIVKKYLNNLPSEPHSFNAFLKHVSPEEYGEYRFVPLRDKKSFLDYIASISSGFSDEYQRYLGQSLNPLTSRLSYQKSFAKYLYKNRENETIQKIVKLLNIRGIQGLAESNGQGFKLLNKHIEITNNEESNPNRSPITAALDMYNFITKSNTKLNHFLPFTLVFDNKNDGTVTSVDFSFLASHYKHVFEDFKQYAEVNKTRTDSETKQQVTIRGQLAVTQMVFKKYHNTLNNDEIEILNKRGLNALAESNNKLLKHFRQLILRDTNSKVIGLSYGIAMQTGLNTVASFFTVEKSNSYRVSNNKTRKLAERNSRRNLYSFEQVVKIAYAIEKCLRRDNLTSLQTLSLHAARILVKTGWNLTPTLELDNDDLVYFDTTFHGNRTAAVRLFKRRAGYKTQWARFSTNESREKSADIELNEFETGKVTAAVISNLESIRDMTNGLAEKHILSNLRQRIFTYKVGEVVKVLNTQSFTDCINSLLKSEMIEDSFSVTRIRKKGMNYTYRKVARLFDKYEKAGMHTPQAFYQYYLRIDGTEAEGSLTKATSVMGDFLLRDISDNVIFVSKPPINSKQTPTGRCVQTQGSEVVTQFKKKNRNFFKEDEISGCADFGACLFCDFFRCIADFDHVWRLLSFEKIVVQRMISASYSIGGDDGSDQQRSIQRIKHRVNDILEELSKINPEAIQKGKALFKEHGIHSDWEVV